MTGRPTTLTAWLAYLESLHPKAIAMGLDRIRAVHARLGARLDCPVITVGGTNGKGSTCAFLDAILRAAGYRVGVYSSPHLLRYNERVRIDRLEATDADLVAAFEAVEDARTAVEPGGTPTQLTFFEFGTLAALWLFSRASLDAVVLEVGLGGRLDAVNLVEADVAVVTSVDLDHQDFLGSTREEIGREKAGIFRPGHPAICGDADPPRSLLDHAAAIGTQLLVLDRDYGRVDERVQWRYHGPGGNRYSLPAPALRGAHQLINAATALAALGLLAERLPVSGGAIRDGLVSVTLAGRFQVLPGRPAIVLDVAHNPHAARVLASALSTMGYFPRTRAVLGMLADKDIPGVVATLRGTVDVWHVATLPGPRGASAEVLARALAAAGVPAASIHAFDSVPAAFAAAREHSTDADRIAVFGSFLTVAAALANLT